jgi:S-DNA-T family DNA segregation ATPase FtsK/SpoIIIE
MAGGAPTAAYANPVLTLVAVDGPLQGQRFPVAGPIEVGRETGPIPLGFDTSASRRHAALAPTPAGLQVTDLGSTNGVLVAGQRVGQALVPIGQTVTIGFTTFRVEA